MKPVPFPWERAIAIGIGALKLAPDEFWRMTPREFAAALRGLYGEPSTPIDRAALEGLMVRFPDNSTAPPQDEARTGSDIDQTAKS